MIMTTSVTLSFHHELTTTDKYQQKFLILALDSDQPSGLQ